MRTLSMRGIHEIMDQEIRVRVIPGDPPIIVESAEMVERDGRPCWLISGHWRRVPLHGGGCVEKTRYIVPAEYTGWEMVA